VLVFAGVVQLIGALVALRKSNTFAATAFYAYGANNTLIARTTSSSPSGLFPQAAGTKLLLGIELFCFAYISLMLAIAAMAVNLEFAGIPLALIPASA
jgi:succinate-acetate transporter protein